MNEIHDHSTRFNFNANEGLIINNLFVPSPHKTNYGLKQLKVNGPRIDFQRDLFQNINQCIPGDYDALQSTFEKILDKHAPQKLKIFCENHKPHINKELSDIYQIKT